MLKLALLGCASLAHGCSGRAESTGAGQEPPPSDDTPPTPGPPSNAWYVPTLYFIADGATRYELADSLPAHIRRGGVFSVSGTGAPLPAGMVLLPTGTLLVGAAVESEARGVEFVYVEP